MKDKASITFNDNILVMVNPCMITLESFQLQDNANLEGNIHVDMNLGPGTVFDLDTVLMKPEMGSLAFQGKFNMKDNILTVKVSEHTDKNFIAVRNASIRQKNVARQPIAANKKGSMRKGGGKKASSPKAQGLQINSPKNRMAPGKSSAISGDKLSIDIREALFNLRHYEFTIDQESRSQSTRLDVVSSLKTGQGSIPLDKGLLTFQSLAIPDFQLTIIEGNDTKKSGSLLHLPSVKFQGAVVKLEQGSDGAIFIETKQLTSKNIKIKGWQDARLTLDTTRLALRKISYQRKKDIIHLNLGPKAKIELGRNNLELLLNPSKKGAPNLTGVLNLNGVLPRITSTVEGSDLQLDNVAVNMKLTFKKQLAIEGTLKTDIPSKTFASALKNVPPPDVKNMKFNPPQFTNTGSMQLKADLKIHGEINNSRLSLAMPQVTDARFTGKAIRNSDINIQAFLSAFKALVLMGGKERGKFSLNLALKNNLSTCCHEEKVKILTGSASEKFYLEPFDNIHVQVQGDITMNKNSLVIKPKNWQQTNDQKIVIKASGDLGSHRLSATLKDKKTKCRVFGIDLPESVCPGNILREELDKLCKKEFIVDL